VCRINHRFGNTLFLTPLLNALEATFPAATVDIALGDKSLAPLLGNRPNVGQIFAFARWDWREIRRFARLALQLRKASYDLVIDPCHDSIGDRMVSAWVHTRGRVGFQTASQWLPLTVAVAPSDQPGHDARAPLVLLQSFVTPQTAPFSDCLDLRLSPEELRTGAEDLRVCTENQLLAGHKTIGFFIDARDRKRLPASWWAGWVEAIRSKAPEVGLVQLVAPGASPAYPGVPCIESADLRPLGAVLANLDLFVSCDTGPMHLASAAGVATLGLFTVTNPVRYGPIGPEDEALEINGMDPALVAERVLARLERVTRGSSVIQDPLKR
jgi:ADP-heptose:LPS heptosyltransferase